MLSAERTSRSHLFAPSRLTTQARISPTRGMPQVADSQMEHIWIITGPAGCGKTTVAQHLAASLRIPYVEGDDFHSAANKEKMAAGEPLTDADRWDWLITLRKEAIKRLQASNAVVVTCSALKQKYRDVIRIANYEHPSVQIHFVYLKVDEHTLQQRVASRVGHYMKEGMVHSQMAALEEPEEEMEPDVIQVDVRNDKEWVQEQALGLVQHKMKEYDDLPRFVAGK